MVARENSPESINCPSCGAVQADVDSDKLHFAKCSECGTELVLGELIGSFRITHVLGEGGMSYVFAASDSLLHRQVAIKVLKGEYSESTKKFASLQCEANAIARLSHPNIVRIYSLGNDEGLLYLVMELVEGESLLQVIQQEGCLSELDGLGLARQLVAGLEAAWRQKVIHRDIKPENILIGKQGGAKIVDFGIAKFSLRVPTDDGLWATPYYVAPETLAEQQEDFRADIYSLGATLYHAVSGVPPCADANHSIARLRLAKRDLGSVAEVAPHLSQRTILLIDKALSYSPSERPQSYAELLEWIDLAERELLTGEKVAIESEFEQIGGKRRNLRAARKQRWARFIVAAGGVILGAVGVYGYLEFRGNGGLKSKTELSRTKLLESAHEKGVADDFEVNGLAQSNSIRDLYFAAQAAIKMGEYRAGLDRFAELRSSPELPLVTFAWCQLEGVVCCLSLSDMDSANELVEELRLRLAEQKGGSTSALLAADQVAALLQLEGPIAVDQLPSVDLPIRYLGSYAIALKNWEQGYVEEAIAWFELFTVTPPRGHIETLPYYLEQAGKYLQDARVLAEFMEVGDVDSLDEVKMLRAKLEPMYEKLVMKGYGQRYARGKLLDLAKLQRNLEGQGGARIVRSGDVENVAVSPEGSQGVHWVKQPEAAVSSLGGSSPQRAQETTLSKFLRPLKSPTVERAKRFIDQVQDAVENEEISSWGASVQTARSVEELYVWRHRVLQARKLAIVDKQQIDQLERNAESWLTPNALGSTNPNNAEKAKQKAQQLREQSVQRGVEAEQGLLEAYKDFDVIIKSTISHKDYLSAEILITVRDQFKSEFSLLAGVQSSYSRAHVQRLMKAQP